MSNSDDATLNPRDFLKALYTAAVLRAQPSHVMADFMPSPPSKAGARTVVVGAGKAAGAMAQAFEAQWLERYPNYPMTGLVVTRYGHTPPIPPALQILRHKHLRGASASSQGLQAIRVIEASHPLPDVAGLAAAEEILKSVRGLTAADLVVCLISGGGSSLLTLPCEGLSFLKKQEINQALLMSGANIGEMNCVRKHLSRIKGGRLAQACGTARLVTLAISDVPGDDVSVIASGPTVPDSTTCADTLAILAKYEISLPANIYKALQDGRLETIKELSALGDECAGDNEQQVQLIATPQQSLQAAADAARVMGVAAYILSDEIEGESREVAKVHAALALSSQRGRSSFKTPCVILSGGETTVTVRPLVDSDKLKMSGFKKGRGGRAGEFCLGLVQALQGAQGIYALAADTDGIDGVEDNAGAFVMPDTLQRAKDKGLSVSDHLARNDSYCFFADLNDLLVTGPTHTNVNDFRAIYLA